MEVPRKHLCTIKYFIKGKRVWLLLLVLFALGIFIYFDELKKKTKYVRESYCPIDNAIAVRKGGRLGNCVWEYISVLGVGETLGYNLYIPKNIHDCLSEVFKNLNIPAYEDTILSDTCRRINGGNADNCKSEGHPPNSTSAWDHLCYTLKYGQYINLDIASKPITEIKKLKDSGKLPTILIMPPWKDLPHALDPIGASRFKKIFQFRDEIKQLAMDTLNGVRTKMGDDDLIFVGIHVRRKDYLRHLHKLKGPTVTLADIDYYKRAMSRMHELYDYARMVFVVLSDDYEWCMKYLVKEEDGVFWGGLDYSPFINNWQQERHMSVSHDLAVLSMTNHTIISYGTFAVTGSLISGGHTIITNISRKAKVSNNFAANLLTVLPNWEQM